SNVVVQSSANFTDLNSSTYWNNASTIVGNRRLFDAYTSYFQDLATDRQDPDYYRTVTTGMRDGMVRAHFFPRAEGDHVVDFLSKVGLPVGTTSRIGMSEWESYDSGIAERRGELASQRGEVGIVRGLMDEEAAESVTGHPNIAMRTLDDSDALPGRIHSKSL